MTSALAADAGEVTPLRSTDACPPPRREPAGHGSLKNPPRPWYKDRVTLVVIGGPTQERVETAVRAFEAEGFRRATTITGDPRAVNVVVPLPVGAAEVLEEADRKGIRYVLVHHGPDDRIENGSYARAHHRIEAPQLMELAQRLGADQKMLVRCIAFAFKEGIPRDSAWVVDARCLDNPYWVDDLCDSRRARPKNCAICPSPARGHGVVELPRYSARFTPARISKLWPNGPNSGLRLQ
jgi:hypothetical protein